MSIPLTFIPAKKRIRRARRRGLPGGAVVDGPLLVGVEYIEAYLVMLHFDRPVNIEHAVPAAITVDDGQQAHQRFEGISASEVEPEIVQIGLSAPTGASTQDQILLSATAGTGITSTDGGAWAGVTDVAIPFGE